MTTKTIASKATSKPVVKPVDHSKGRYPGKQVWMEASAQHLLDYAQDLFRRQSADFIQHASNDEPVERWIHRTKKFEINDPTCPIWKDMNGRKLRIASIRFTIEEGVSPKDYPIWIELYGQPRESSRDGYMSITRWHFRCYPKDQQIVYGNRTIEYPKDKLFQA
jgi:hypothetical protein